MLETIPPIDPSPPSVERLERAEFEGLEAEAKLRRLVQREHGQRYAIKWIALAVGFIVIVFMGLVLMHLVHQVVWGPFLLANSAFSVAMVIAPIASITAITIALFVGAFRKFDDKEVESASSAISTTLQMLRG